jgi:hypothetical protein
MTAGTFAGQAIDLHENGSGSGPAECAAETGFVCVSGHGEPLPFCTDPASYRRYIGRKEPELDFTDSSRDSESSDTSFSGTGAFVRTALQQRDDSKSLRLFLYLSFRGGRTHVVSAVWAFDDPTISRHRPKLRRPWLRLEDVRP